MNFYSMTEPQRKAHLLEQASQTCCAILVYMDEYGKLNMCATAEKGHESCLFDCISLVACRAEAFFDEHLDMNFNENEATQS